MLRRICGTDNIVVWVAIKEEEEIRRVAGEKAIKRQQSEAEARRDEMRREAGLGSK